MTTKLTALRSVPLFQGMSDHSVESIAELAADASFAAGAILVREGDPGDSFLIIREGSATVEQGGNTVRELGSGDFLGEISLIDAGRGRRPSSRAGRWTRGPSTGPGSPA